MTRSDRAAQQVQHFDHWRQELLRLAKARDLEWIVGTTGDAHRAAYDKGLTADEELSALADMAEWRGCGCGGGG